MASPNFSKTQVFASTTAPAAARFGLLVLVSCLRNPPSQPGSIGLLLQLDSIPYFQCQPLGQGIAATTGTGDLTVAAASTVEVENMVHSDLMSPTSLRVLVKTLPEVGVEDPPDRGFRQTFPADPHDAFGSARSVQLPPLPADPTHHQVVIS